MRRIHVIGIGAGDPEHLTLQAVNAMRDTDVFFLLGKGEEKQELIDLRQEMLATHAREGHRVVEARDPDRDRTPARYASEIDQWRRARADIYEALIRDELGEDGRGAFLVWGDPALYDSTLAILEEVLGRGEVAFEYTVVPGVSSVSTLAARHRVGLNRVGRPFQVTTGRRLAEGWPADVDDVVVMLDARHAFSLLPAEERAELDIYWGAYLGTPDELLVSGPLDEVADEIEHVRSTARDRKGWIMDTYLLRRRDTAEPASEGTGGGKA
ncbi:precorrin-6A synthase (deacetylating) [Streptomyces alkaliterrae]|uniref:Precorrin-6A synthase (Deacetylating) n=1 Tax=Streptomyces alkaliterrae TaxID=2213162 RepID=A0A5P0YUH8_9ACTN|nr:precorrin-6A synthase (deacetylating) [Streptomyces alkaliterrae]MBB1260723.1 precorrin-6A synthase (deacetylating) [Streptomyces alkaliterrae]MQS03964.1 precorrin-6A synthase (deacetylating) [Streptomyces alkaliterrae]